MIFTALTGVVSLWLICLWRHFKPCSYWLPHVLLSHWDIKHNLTVSLFPISQGNTESFHAKQNKIISIFTSVKSPTATSFARPALAKPGAFQLFFNRAVFHDFSWKPGTREFSERSKAGRCSFLVPVCVFPPDEEVSTIINQLMLICHECEVCQSSLIDSAMEEGAPPTSGCGFYFSEKRKGERKRK